MSKVSNELNFWHGSVAGGPILEFVNISLRIQKLVHWHISKTALFMSKVLAGHISNPASTLKPGMLKAYFWYKEGLGKILGKVYKPVFLSVFCTGLQYWEPCCNQL